MSFLLSLILKYESDFLFHRTGFLKPFAYSSTSLQKADSMSCTVKNTMLQLLYYATCLSEDYLRGVPDDQTRSARKFSPIKCTAFDFQAINVYKNLTHGYVL